MTVLIGMFLLGLFIALGSWVISWSDHVKSELQIKVYFVDDVTPKQVNAVGTYLRTDSRIGEYHFVSRADALKYAKKHYPKELTENLASNPLPGVVRDHAAAGRRPQADLRRHPRRRSSSASRRSRTARSSPSASSASRA